MDSLNLIYYSPNGTTQKIVEHLGLETGLKIISDINLIKKQSNIIINDSLTIIGMPVYGGRLPTPAVEALKKIHSNKSPVVIIVVYGNRHYDDALLELKSNTQNSGFKVIAGATFIGEHSFSSDEKPIAINRPDEQDLQKCGDFAQMILNNLNKEIYPIIPGNYPYKEHIQFPEEALPITNINLCNHCTTCIDVCPTNAIKNDKQLTTFDKLCIRCCACIKQCPNKARFIDHPLINKIKETLFLNFSERKEPEFFV